MKSKISKYAIYSLFWPAMIWMLFFTIVLFQVEIIDALNIAGGYTIVFGLLVHWLLVIAGYVGVIYGVIALLEIKKDKSAIRGKFLAIMGIVIWWVIFVAYIWLEAKDST